MTAWTTEELATIEAADELQIASRRRDGTLSSPRTIWVVRHGDDLYVRSVNGPTAAWYRAVRATQRGHVRAGSVEKDVAFVDVDGAVDDQIDAAYEAKYGRRYPTIVPSIVNEAARSATLRLVPRATT